MVNRLDEDIRPRKLRPVFKNIADLDRVRNLMLALPVENKANQVLYGYKPSKDNPDMLEPDEKIIELLLRAKEYLRTCSFAEVAAWLTAESGERISAEGLRKLMLTRQPVDECRRPREEREKL